MLRTCFHQSILLAGILKSEVCFNPVRRRWRKYDWQQPIHSVFQRQKAWWDVCVGRCIADDTIRQMYTVHGVSVTTSALSID